MAVLIWLQGGKTRGDSASWHLPAGQQHNCLLRQAADEAAFYLSKYSPVSGILCVLALCFTKINQTALNISL